jgi:hypothetical protein
MTRRAKIVVWVVVVALGLPCIGMGILFGLMMYLARTYPSPLGYQAYMGGLVTCAGTYKLKSGERLEVKVDRGLVDFELFAEDGHKILKNDLYPSTFHKWSLCIDDQKWVWLDSGDIGTWVWTTYTSADWHGKQVKGNAALEASAPKEIRIR